MLRTLMRKLSISGDALSGEPDSQKTKRESLEDAGTLQKRTAMSRSQSMRERRRSRAKSVFFSDSVTTRPKSHPLKKFFNKIANHTEFDELPQLSINIFSRCLVTEIERLKEQCQFNEVTPEAMKGHKIMRGMGRIAKDYKPAPFIAFCVKTKHVDKKSQADLNVIFLTLSEKDGAAVFTLVRNNGNDLTHYRIDNEDERKSCEDIVGPLIKGKSINAINDSTNEKDEVIKLVLTDQSEFSRSGKKRSLFSI